MVVQKLQPDLLLFPLPVLTPGDRLSVIYPLNSKRNLLLNNYVARTYLF